VNAATAVTGIVFHVQHYSIHDGPGIRSTVFLKGCPLQCLWCHNPEGISFEREIAYHDELCMHCGACLSACPNGCLTADGETIVHSREHCTVCGKCAEACCSEARVLNGRERSVGDVLQEVLQDRVFYEQSGGGMTLSGGEPLAQPDFALEALRQAKQAGIHTVVDTCGCVPMRTIEAAAELTDLFLFDLKCHDAALHKRLTGVDNALILSNFAELSQRSVPLMIRIPLVPGCNDSEDELKRLAAHIAKVNPTAPVQILPYHGFAAYKYRRMRKEYFLEDLAEPDATKLQSVEKLFRTVRETKELL